MVFRSRVAVNGLEITRVHVFASGWSVDSFEVSLSCLISGRRGEEPSVDEEERPESKSLCGGLPGSLRALGGQENFAPGLGDYDQVPPNAVLESRRENQGKVGKHFRPTRSGMFISENFSKEKNRF